MASCQLPEAASKQPPCFPMHPPPRPTRFNVHACTPFGKVGLKVLGDEARADEGLRLKRGQRCGGKHRERADIAATAAAAGSCSCTCPVTTQLVNLPKSRTLRSLTGWEMRKCGVRHSPV